MRFTPALSSSTPTVKRSAFAAAAANPSVKPISPSGPLSLPGRR